MKYSFWNMSVFTVPTCLVLAILFVFPTAEVLAGEWRVSPARIEIERGARSSVVKVFNESQESLVFTSNAMQWTQDSDGKDQYKETAELIFFPKVLNINPGESRVIRIGVKAPAVKKEKTYRLFIKEQPPATTGGKVALAMQFAVPVFSKPLQEEFSGKFENVDFVNNQLSFSLKNSGNVHFRVSAINLSGKDKSGVEIFKNEIQGWYVLEGVSRTYSVDLDEALCKKLQAIDILANTDYAPLNKQITINQDSCSSSQ